MGNQAHQANPAFGSSGGHGGGTKKSSPENANGHGLGLAWPRKPKKQGWAPCFVLEQFYNTTRVQNFLLLQNKFIGTRSLEKNCVTYNKRANALLFIPKMVLQTFI
jgi:hypothetical protein